MSFLRPQVNQAMSNANDPKSLTKKQSSSGKRNSKMSSRILHHADSTLLNASSSSVSSATRPRSESL